MASVTVAPNRDEWAPSQSEYEDFVSALQEAGHDAWLQEPRDGGFSAGGIVTDQAIELSLFLWEQVSEETIGLIVGLAVERLRRRGKKRKRKGVIYGPDGEVLRTFDLPSKTDK